MSPFAGEPGLWPVVPDGNLSESVADTCNVVAGEAVPIPTLLFDTSKANKFVSNVKSVPDLPGWLITSVLLFVLLPFCFPLIAIILVCFKTMNIYRIVL